MSIKQNLKILFTFYGSKPEYEKKFNEAQDLIDDFAIRFYEWRNTSFIPNLEQYSNREIIQIFKNNEKENER